MNNKIKLNTLLDAGGVIEIRLFPDVRVFGADYYFAANSLQTAREMMQKILKAETLIFFHTKTGIERVIESINFRWHGVAYVPEFSWDEFRNYILFDTIVHNISLKGEYEVNKMYLKAENKVYGNW